jgi:SAM-dependent methyltransferase
MRLVDLFDNASLYKLFQYSISRRNTLKVMREEILKPDGVQDVLDFGCGIGYHSLEFPSANYLGIEPLQSCINKAHELFNESNRRFILGDHITLKEIPDSSFDLIIAIGVLHHINDDIVSEFLEESRRILRKGGRLTTFDPVLHKDQSTISRWVVKQDRGKWVRSEAEYSKLLTRYFPGKVEQKIYTDLLKIPYDHVTFSLIKQTMASEI